jgi:hypothetical protein
LEPWILLQMPFEPALLHQWAVTLLAEALLFQNKISPIFSYGCPSKVAKITQNLKQMLLAMKNCANFTLELYLKMCFEASEDNFHSSLQREFETLSSHLNKVLPILAFTSSKEAPLIISAITNICLEELNNGSEVDPPQVVLLDSEEQPTPLYDFWFWTNDCDLMTVFTGSSSDTRCYSELLEGIEVEFVGEGTNDLVASDLKRLVHMEILNTGRLEGVSQEIIMAAIEENIFELHYHSYFLYDYTGMHFFLSL